jgi:hypothetical protein
MLLTPESAMTELRRAIPSFESDWAIDRLSYLLFNDFARFICSEAEVLQYVKSADEALRLSQVSPCMQFLERLLEEGDSIVRDLVFETIETLDGCVYREDIKKWAGAAVSAIWNKQPWRNSDSTVQ